MPNELSGPRLRFGFQFAVLARQWRRTLEKSLEESGLTDATWAPLLHLQETGDGISQKDLAVRVGIDGSSLVRLLDILAHKGLIERQVDKDDRRARLIFLTRAGRDAVKEIRRLLSKAETEMLSDLSDDELHSITDAFDRIGRRLHHIQEHQDKG